MRTNFSAARMPSKWLALAQQKANINTELATIATVVSLLLRTAIATRNAANKA